MQLTALTQKSALPAIMLLVVIVITTALRSRLAPYAIEVADTPFLGTTSALILAVITHLITGFVEGKVQLRSGLSKGYNTLSIPLYGLLACGIAFSPNALTSAAASLCFALAMHLLLRSLHQTDERDSLFFASFLLGTMVLLTPPSIVLVGVIPLVFIILALSLRQLVLMIVGYITPLFAASYIVWYRGGEFWDLARNLFSHLATPQMESLQQLPYLAIAMIVGMVAIFIWGAIYSAIRPDKMLMLARVRRSIHLFVWLLLLTLSMVFIPSCNLSILAIVAIPATTLLSFIFSLLPSNHSTIAYWALLLLFIVHLFVA
jgi:hypothetical protein